MTATHQAARPSAAVLEFRRDDGGSALPLAVQRLGPGAPELCKKESALQRLVAQAEAAWRMGGHPGWEVLQLGGNCFEVGAGLGWAGLGCSVLGWAGPCCAVLCCAVPRCAVPGRAGPCWADTRAWAAEQPAAGLSRYKDPLAPCLPGEARLLSAARPGCPHWPSSQPSGSTCCRRLGCPAGL